MDFLAFLMAVAALLWSWWQNERIKELEYKQGLMGREAARRLDDLLQRIPAVPVREPTAPVPASAPDLPVAFVEAPPLMQPVPPPSREPLGGAPEERKVAPDPPPYRHIPPPPVTKPAFDWEGLVGVKLFSWIAGVAMVLAGVFFLRYSVEHGWLSAPIRMAIGLLTGIATLVVCEWRVARRYAVTANALDAAGIAILFATFFAAHARWGLLPAVPTFLFMAAVTALAAVLSIRHNSVFLAMLGLVGGFATPALLSTGEDRALSLFTYLLLLNAGLSWVAYKKNWPYLTALSAVFTTLYQWVWVMQFLEPARLPLAFGIFLMFPALNLGALVLRGRSAEGQSPLFRKSAAVSAALPVVFSFYMAAVPGYGNQYGLLFLFLFLVDAGLTAIAIKRGPEILHLAGSAGVLLTFITWMQRSYTSPAWPAILPIVVIFVLFHLVVSYRAKFKDVGAFGVFTAPMLLVVFPILIGIEPATASLVPIFGTLFALIAAIAVYSVARGESGVHYAAAFFAVVAGVVWSVRHLTLERTTSALALYLIFGLLYVAVPLLAQRWRTEVNQLSLVVSHGLYLALAAHLLLFFVAVRGSSTPPWLFLTVVAILDLVIAAAALITRRFGAHLGALAATQSLLLAWLLASQTAPWPSVAALAAVIATGIGMACFAIARKLSVADSALMGASGVTAGFLGMGVLVVGANTPGSPGVLLMAISASALVASILAVDKLLDWRLLSPFAVISAGLLLLVWSVAPFAAESWIEELLLASVLYALFMLYPLWLGPALKKALSPLLGSVLASVIFFISARASLTAGGFGDFIGFLPVFQALLLGGLLWKLLHLEAPGERELGRLALVAGAALAFVTVAVPLQLEKEWITIGWVLQAAALAWLYRRVQHDGLLMWTGGLLIVVFARLALNPAVLTYHPRSATPILNWYLYTYLVSAVAFFGVAWLLRHLKPTSRFGIGPLAAAGGTALLFLLLNIEIAAFYSTGATLTFDFSAGLGQDLTYTIAWGLFAFALLSAGIIMARKPARTAAIILLSVTIGKCFLLDLSRLDGLYRIGSFVGLAVCLILVALLLQKFVLRTGDMSRE